MQAVSGASEFVGCSPVSKTHPMDNQGIVGPRSLVTRHIYDIYFQRQPFEISEGRLLVILVRSRLKLEYRIRSMFRNGRPRNLMEQVSACDKKYFTSEKFMDLF